MRKHVWLSGPNGHVCGECNIRYRDVVSDECPVQDLDVEFAAAERARAAHDAYKRDHPEIVDAFQRAQDEVELRDLTWFGIATRFVEEHAHRVALVLSLIGVLLNDIQLAIWCMLAAIYMRVW